MLLTLRPKQTPTTQCINKTQTNRQVANTLIHKRLILLNPTKRQEVTITITIKMENQQNNKSEAGK